MKKFFNYAMTIWIAAVCFFGISAFFIFSGNLMEIFANSLKLKVSPNFTGGEIASEFFDEVQDDNGSGNLIYPLNVVFTDGSLDLIRYAVHVPVREAKWQQSSEYWQLDLDFLNGSAEVRNIMIYVVLGNDFSAERENYALHTDDLNQSVSTDTLFEGAEFVTFHKNYPWNYAIWFNGSESKIFNAKKELLAYGETAILNKGKTLQLRIPLENKELQKVYGAKKTFHYVLVGAKSEFDRGGFMPVEKRRSLSRGGVKTYKDYNSLIPKVYDILGNNSQLATWNTEDLAKAVLEPVEVDMNLTDNNASKLHDEKEFANRIKKSIAESNSQNQMNDGEYFGHKTLEDAVNYFQAKLENNPDDFVSMAYLGSCIAMKGGQSNVIQAVALVNKAFEYLDKATELSYNKEEETEVLLNRANVCLSVPESVFKKAETKEKLYVLEKELPSSSFFRANKAVIVNLDTIKSIAPAFGGRYEAILYNGYKVIISRNYVAELKTILGL